MRQIIITIATDGTSTVDAQGFKGKGCADASEQIEIALGGTGTKKKTKKPEYFAPAGSGSSKNKLTF